MQYCYNLPEGWVPIKEYIPNQEFYDKVMEAIKKNKTDSRKEKTTSKKESMSNVSHRYW